MSYNTAEPKKVYIAVMRHGEYEQPKGVPSALLPHPLTERGRQQSKEAAKEIIKFAEAENLEISRIIDTSKLLRAYETGTILAKELEKLSGKVYRVSEFEELAERSVGAVANLRVEEIETILDKDPRYTKPASGWKSNSWYKLPFMGAESLMESGLRVAQHFQDRVDELETLPKNMLKIFIGHGASIRHASLTLGLLKSSDIPKYSMHYSVPLFFKRSEQEWSLVSGEWKLRAPKQEAID